MHSSKEYSSNWQHYGPVLVYCPTTFQYHPRVIITEFNDCLISSISRVKIYNTRNAYKMNIFAQEYIDCLKNEDNVSIVVISNQINNSKEHMDFIKTRVELLENMIQLNILFIFALKPNMFSKPHTGSFRFLKQYFKKNEVRIQKIKIVSNEGGLILDKKKKDTITPFVCSSDIDRAFAYNIQQCHSDVSAEYLAIDEYLGSDKIPFRWDSSVIPPEARSIYLEEINKYPQVNVFKEMGDLKGVDTYIIFIMGAPRCGKTKFAKELIKKWDTSEFGKSHALFCLSQNNISSKKRITETKKLIKDRISVIIDGDCYTDAQREPYIGLAKKYNLSIICIEVNCGIEMAKVFNHSHIETTTKMTDYLYKDSNYRIYRSHMERPKNIKHVMVIPRIEESTAIMNFRY